MKCLKRALILGILCLVCTSMAMATSFDNVKEYTEPTLEDKYGVIEIKNWLGLGETLAEYKLTANSDGCLNDCYAEGTVVTTIETALMSGFSFKSRENKKIAIPHTKFIGTVRDVPYTAYDVVETCRDEVNKNTSIAYSVCTYSNVPRAATRQEVVWTEYKGERVKAGAYYWKVTADKPINLRVDWVMEIDDAELGTFSLVEWLWWNVTYSYKRGDTVTHSNTGTLVNFTYLVNGTSGFFLDGNTAQICWCRSNINATNYLYYNSYTDYAFSNGSENAELSCECEYGNNTELSVPNPNAYDDELTRVYHAYNNLDSKGNYNMTFLNVSIVDGKFGNAWNFSENDASYANSTMWNKSNSTITFWAYTPLNLAHDNAVISQALSGSNYIVCMYLSSGKFDCHRQNGYGLVESTGNITAGWNHFAYVCTSSDRKLYVNGVLNDTSTELTGGCWNSSNANFRLGTNAPAYTSQELGGKVDELRMYNSELSVEYIKRDYEMGLSVLGAEEISTPNVPVVTLSNPSDNYKATNSSITFNCSASVSLGTIANITLNLDGVANYTESETEANATIEHTIDNIAEGTHTWNCNATGSENDKSAATNWALELHTSYPQITITNYSSSIIIYSLPVYTAINWTVTDTKFNSSWLYNGTNTSALCNGTGLCGITIPISSGGEKTYTIYANDSFNIINSTTFNITVYYITSEITESANEVVEGQSVTLTLTVNLSYINIPDTNATLYWNNTNYGQGTKVKLTDTSYRYTKTFNVPNIGTIAGALMPYYWTYNISSLGIYENSSIDNQTVKQFSLSFDCTGTNAGNATVINFSLYEEPSWSKMYEGNFTSTFIVWTNDRALNRTFNVNKYVQQNFTVCLYPNRTLFYADMIAEFSGTSYATRTYYLNNVTLNTSGGEEELVDLYLLATAAGTEIDVYTYDLQDVGIPNKYVHISRYDVSTNTYKTVEIVKTDDVGHGVAFLRQNDAFYKFVVKAYPNIIELISDARELTTATVQLYPGASTFTSKLEVVDGIYHVLTFDKPTLTFNAEFVSSSSYITGCLKVEKKRMTGTVQICEDCAYGLNGALHCTIDNTTGTYSAVFYNRLNPYGVWDVMEYISRTGELLTEKIGLANANFLCMLLILVVAFATSFNPAVCILAVTITVSALVGIGLFSISLTSFMFLVIIAIALVARLKS